MNLPRTIKSTFIVLATAAFLASCSGKQESESHEGTMSIHMPWSLEVPETQTMSAGFMTIENGTGENDALVSATSDISAVTELHEMAMEGETMKMRKIDRIEIPAGEKVELKRGGLHLMFIDLKKIPVEGDSIQVELTFEKAGKMQVTLPVKKGDAPASEHEHH